MYDMTYDDLMAGLKALEPARRGRAPKRTIECFRGNDTSPEDIARCRAARALLGWKQAELAYRAKLTELTVSNFERATVRPRNSTLAKLQTAFESAGIEFLDLDETGGIGVRLVS